MIRTIDLHFPAHVIGVCGPSPILPGWLVLSITARTIDVPVLKIIACVLFKTALSGCQTFQLLLKQACLWGCNTAYYMHA